MNDLVNYIYSNGDVVLMTAKIFVLMYLLMFTAVIIGTIRGLKV